AEDGIRDDLVTGVQTCALPIFLEHREGFRVPEAVAAAHDHVGLFRTESALPGEFLKVRESRVDVRWPELDGLVDDLARPGRIVRSEERRVGKEGRARERSGRSE